MELHGKRAIVTGGGSGFGSRLVERLIAAGALVAAFDVDADSLERLKRANPEAVDVRCDVSDSRQVEQCTAEVFDDFGGIDILVNNAGIMHSAPLINPLNREDRRHPLDLWQRVMAVNTNSVFYMTRTVVDGMIQRRNKGVIINVSSIAARGNAGQTAYSASKAAVEAMTVVWAKEFGGMGIRCVAVAPGFCDTAGAAEAIEEKMLKKWVDQTPLRRIGHIDEIVSTMLFAIENDFVNGVTLSVNGGLRL